MKEESRLYKLRSFYISKLVLLLLLLVVVVVVVVVVVMVDN
jgi:hypothetical protein